jgi:hypothetical protein
MSSFLSAKEGKGSRHLIASVLLLAIFFLPLHFHPFTLAAQVSKDCSCYHGGRTQIGLAPGPLDWAPTYQASFIIVREPQLFGWFSVDSHSIRAPPAISSL